MKPCISLATTLSTSFEASLDAIARGGWQSVELWLTQLETCLDEGKSIDDLRSMLTDRGLTPAAAASQGGLLLSSGPERQAHWDHFRRRLDLLKTIRVSTLIVAVDHSSDPAPDDYRRASESLAEAGELVRSLGIRIALEFQKSSRFCTSLDTALALIAQSGSAEVGVCLDLFHYYTGPSKFEDLGYLSRENLAWVQVCDLSGVPRELAGDSDRIFPGEGDFQLPPILDHLRRIGYDGFVSLELLNPQLWRIPADRVADLAYQATIRALGPVEPVIRNS
jgi:sugar phosphate isomerase/epimerase